MHRSLSLYSNCAEGFISVKQSVEGLLDGRKTTTANGRIACFHTHPGPPRTSIGAAEFNDIYYILRQAMPHSHALPTHRLASPRLRTFPSHETAYYIVNLSIFPPFRWPSQSIPINREIFIRYGINKTMTKRKNRSWAVRSQLYVYYSNGNANYHTKFCLSLPPRTPATRRKGRPKDRRRVKAKSSSQGLNTKS